jgi:hypothetical protein
MIKLIPALQAPDIFQEFIKVILFSGGLQSWEMCFCLILNEKMILYVVDSWFALNLHCDTQIMHLQGL